MFVLIRIVINLQVQYKFLHEVAYEALCSTSDPIPYEEFLYAHRQLHEIDKASNKTNMMVEYEVMYFEIRAQLFKANDIGS